MTVHAAHAKLAEALRLVRSVISATGNPVIRGSLRIAEGSLSQTTDTILDIPFHHESETAMNLFEPGRDGMASKAIH